MKLTSKQARRIFYKYAYHDGFSFSSLKRAVKRDGFVEVLLKGRYGDALHIEKKRGAWLTLYGPLSRNGREYLR